MDSAILCYLIGYLHLGSWHGRRLQCINQPDFPTGFFSRIPVIGRSRRKDYLLTIHLRCYTLAAYIAVGCHPGCTFVGKPISSVIVCGCPPERWLRCPVQPFFPLTLQRFQSTCCHGEKIGEIFPLYADCHITYYNF